MCLKYVTKNNQQQYLQPWKNDHGKMWLTYKEKNYMRHTNWRFHYCKQSQTLWSYIFRFGNLQDVTKIYHWQRKNNGHLTLNLYFLTCYTVVLGRVNLTRRQYLSTVMWNPYFFKQIFVSLGGASNCHVTVLMEIVKFSTCSTNNMMKTLQVKTILVAMVTKILELATKLEQKSPAWQLKLRRRIESVSLI